MPHHPSQYGTSTKLTIDYGDETFPDGEPEEGDFLASEAGAVYLVTRAYRMRGAAPNKWRFECVRFDPADMRRTLAEVGGRVWSFYWVPRNRA